MSSSEEAPHEIAPHEIGGGFEASCSGPTSRLVAALRPALAELAKAHHFAEIAKRSCWEFAIPRSTLRGLGLTDTDLRWLTCQGYILGARDVTQPEDDVRSFRPSRNLVFGKQTCFVLTDAGKLFACCSGQSVETCRAQAPNPAPAESANQHSSKNDTPAASNPVWDAGRRELRYQGQIVKRYRVPARNQALILTAFQEEAWPHYIDDPLPPAGEQDPKHRLQATVKSLNRNQQTPLLRFHGNGNGLQIFWDAVRPE